MSKLCGLENNLDILLIVEGHKFVLTEASPAKPTTNAFEAVRQ